MFKISVWHGNLSEDYLRFVTQLGVDCLDFGQGDFFPGVKEQGYPDLDALLKIKKKVRSWGLEFDDADHSKVIRYAWQQYSNVLQSGNAEMILSAVG